MDAAWRRILLCVVVGAATLTACSDPAGDAAPSTSTSTVPSTTEATTTTTEVVDPTWAPIDRRLHAMGPHVGFLAARVAPDGTCQPIHQVHPTTLRPTASQFKLYVLGALADEVAAGRISWDQTVTVVDSVRSVGNAAGSLQVAPTGTVVPVREAALNMIWLSDNTATDLLIGLIGRDAIEDQIAEWGGDRLANTPLLTTRQMFLLHYVKGLGRRYLEEPRDERAAYLAAEVDTRELDEMSSGYTTDPRFVEEIEWFASPEGICRAFSGLRAAAERAAPSTTLSEILSRETAAIGLDPTAWPTVWFKGGSEPGVLTLGWLATNRAGETYVVEAMVCDPDQVLATTSITDLVALARDAFARLP